MVKVSPQENPVFPLVVVAVPVSVCLFEPERSCTEDSKNFRIADAGGRRRGAARLIRLVMAFTGKKPVYGLPVRR
ncbi:MAG: hypothetical protein ACLR8Y_00135 [Alistipes indistinctus]